MISNLKENLQSAKNTIVNLENKNKNLENEICDLKQDHQHLESTKMKKQDANLAKVIYFFNCCFNRYFLCIFIVC